MTLFKKMRFLLTTNLLALAKKVLYNFDKAFQKGLISMKKFNAQMLEEKMKEAIKSLQKNFSGLRTGRASTALLEPMTIEAYGGKTPLTQLATISAPKARLLTVQVWDGSVIKAVEKAICDSNIGLNPSVEGNTIFVSLPELTQERREELVKKAKEYSEKSRIAIRNIRREGMEQIHHMEHESECSEDEMGKMQKEVQKLTDEFIKKIDALYTEREKEIREI